MPDYFNAGPNLPISAYLDCPDTYSPPLQNHQQHDVVIIGGGFTGMSAALSLKEKGVDVAIVEAEFCGFGSSGRNAGHITPTIGKDLPTLLMMYGAERTGELVRFADYCVKTTEALIDRYAIDCDYQPTGNIMAAVHPSQEKRLKKAATVAGQMGGELCYLEQSDMRDRGLPSAFISGVWDRVGGTYNPGKLAQGLRDQLFKAGVSVYEKTTVTKIEDAPRQGATLHTASPNGARGAVKADHIVMATNAYSRPLGGVGKQIIPLKVTMFETQPLTDSQVETIGGWTNREGIYTAHESLESFRLTADQTIIGGSRGVVYSFGAKTGPTDAPDPYARGVMTQAFSDRFAAIRDTVVIKDWWAGWIGMTMNFLPIVGPIKNKRGQWQAIGYNGHGVTQALTCGSLLADQIRGLENGWAALAPQGRFPIAPTEPFIWLYVTATLGLVNAYDAHMDRKIRAQTA